MKSPEYHDPHEKLEEIKPGEYVIVDFSGEEPFVLANKITDDPKAFVREYEKSINKSIADNPDIVVGLASPSENSSD